jgi:hypothetical protein
VCKSSYSEESAELVRKGWYAREVRRMAVDKWEHGGSSLRRVAEFARSLLGHQERWEMWCAPTKREEGREGCYLAASSVHRWLDGAGRAAQRTVAGQLEGIASSGRMGTDGLWARLRGGEKRVVLVVTDSVSGLVYPPVVVEGEESAGPWKKLFARAQAAGLNLEALRGVTSDGAHGLSAYLREGLAWVNQQRCILHSWLNLSKEMAHAVRQAAEGLAKESAQAARKQARKELLALIHGIMDAQHYEAAESVLQQLKAHTQGGAPGGEAECAVGSSAGLSVEGAERAVARRPRVAVA